MGTLKHKFHHAKHLYHHAKEIVLWLCAGAEVVDNLEEITKVVKHVLNLVAKAFGADLPE